MPRLFEQARRRVLVVDDDPAIVELVTTRLDLAGYKTFVARDGFQALTMMAEAKPGAMVLDINMPRLDGFGVLRQMKLTNAADRVATMVLTARNRPDDVRAALLLGVRDYLAKPFKDDVLLRRVERLFLQRPARVPANPWDSVAI